MTSARDARRLSQAVEGVEAASARSLYASAPAHVVAELGVAHERVGGADCFLVRGSRHRYLNRVVGLGVRRAATDATIERIIALYRDHGAPRVTFEVTAQARPSDLGSRLQAHGCRATGGTGKLWRGDAPVTRTAGELPVRRVGPQRADEWFTVYGGVFRHFRNRGDWFKAPIGRPGWSHFAAFDGDAIVGIGTLFVAGGVAHLVEGATLTVYRRHGIQRRIIEARVRAGLRQGVRLFTSESAPPLPRTPLISYRNLRRVGFELAYIRAGYRLELI